MCHLTWADLPLDLEWQPLHGAHGSAAGFRAFLSPLAGGGAVLDGAERGEAHFVSRVSRAHRGNTEVSLRNGSGSLLLAGGAPQSRRAGFPSTEDGFRCRGL